MFSNCKNMSLGLGKWPNVFVKLGLGFFITCHISKSNTLSWGFILLFPAPSPTPSDRTWVDDSWACGATEIHIKAPVVITCSCCIVKKQKLKSDDTPKSKNIPT